MARNHKAKSDIELVLEIVEAWNNPGVQPDFHKQMQRMLRQSWPSLAEPVRELAGRAKKRATRQDPFTGRAPLIPEGNSQLGQYRIHHQNGA